MEEVQQNAFGQEFSDFRSKTAKHLTITSYFSHVGFYGINTFCSKNIEKDFPKQKNIGHIFLVEKLRRATILIDRKFLLKSN